SEKVCNFRPVPCRRPFDAVCFENGAKPSNAACLSFARRLGDKKTAASRPNRQSAFYQLSEQVERSNRCFTRNPAASPECFYRVGGQAFLQPWRCGPTGPRTRPGSKPARYERCPGGKYYYRTGRSHASPPSPNRMVKVARRVRSGASRK